ncbi:germination protein [Paenibacillus marchantiophytorum]|uniref:Germination protein n=1 Tax=Paenibacillus marchantiophytorum TaxID=1619310 RepID=A0ABQ1ELS6_9BACL|nr:endospore germination permease [Paenibacillus marchantiophytorum]GFZ77649.1 germination protein [Paenibacillus marchantiophytorum]
MENRIISTKQLAILVIYFIIGDMLLILPSLTAAASKQDAWLSGGTGFLVGWPIAWLLFRFSRLFPKLTLVQYNRVLLGKWAGGFITIFYLYYFLTSVSILIREVGDFLKTQIFTVTPLHAIHIMMIILLVWGVKSGLETIARTSETFFPLYLLLFFSLFILLIPQVKFEKLHPFMGEGILAIIHGSLYSSTFTFCELCTFLMIFPQVISKDHTQRDYLLGVTFGGIAISSTILLTITVIGPNLASIELYAAYLTAQKINIGNFVQRVEAILAINWIISTYFKCILDFYALLLGTSQLLNLRDYRILSVPAGFVIFGLAFAITTNIVYFNSIVSYYIFWDATCALGIPLLLYFVYLVRKNKLIIE